MTRARRSNPRPPARRGGAVSHAALRLPPPVNGFSTLLTDPPVGTSSSSKTPAITVTGFSSILSPVDIQIEWRRVAAAESSPGSGVWLPTPSYAVSISDAVSGTPQTSVPPADLAYGTWWYRARSGDEVANIWGAWTPGRWLDVRPVLGSLTQYVEINIGVVAPPLMGTIAYAEMNVGLSATEVLETLAAYTEMNVGLIERKLGATAYADLNIGPKLGQYQGAAYTDINVVTGETPTPHIWWIRPEQGKEGYVFNIYGQGFGSFKTQYDGQVKLGALVCAISRWELVPAEMVASLVRVTGIPRATASTTLLPNVRLNSSSVTIAAGDIIEYDMIWESPPSSRLDIFPYFRYGGSVVGYDGGMLLNDTTGDAWFSDQPEAYGAWHHRQFIVPPGHNLVGKAITDFGIAWYGYDPAAPQRTGAIRSFVIRNTGGTPKLWVTGDDNTSAPPLTYVANTGVLSATEFSQESYRIEHGVGLDPDVITPEHGWIVAVVPTGAVSDMVRVILEDV